MNAATAAVLPPFFRERLAAAWRHHGALLLVLDGAVVLSTFLLCYQVRFAPVWYALPPAATTGAYFKGAVLLTAFWVFLLWRDGGYARGFRGLRAPYVRLKSLCATGALAVGGLMAFSFLQRDLLLSRLVYVTAAGASLGVMALTRVALRWLDQDLAAQGVGVTSLLPLGGGEELREFCRRLQELSPTYRVLAPSPVTISPAALRARHRREPFERVVVSQGELEACGGPHGLVELLNTCEALGVELYALPRPLQVAVREREVAALSGLPLIQLRDAACHPVYAAGKRLFDLVVAATVLVLGMPLWAAVALLVKLTGRGPVFFVQERIGLHGRPFRMFKFRTMVPGAPREYRRLVPVEQLTVPGAKLEADPRITPVGRWLRRYSLDEIPQLLNVLKGDMSLVGPRPELPCLVARYDPVARRRLKGKPGITGLQQVAARNRPLAAALDYDLIYLKEQNFLVDLYILVRTLFVLGRGR